MKKEIKVIAIVLVSLIVFLSGFGIGATNGININFTGEINVNGSTSSDSVVVATTAATVTEATTTAAVVDTTVATDTSVDTTEAPADDSTDTTEAETTTEAASTTPTTTAEYAALYNEIVNAAKAAQNITVYRYEIISLNLTDCSVSMLTSGINAILQTFIEPTERTTVITNGFTDGGTGSNTASNYIYPTGTDATVQADYLTGGSYTENADGGYTLVINFISETSTFDGTTTTNPVAHESAMEPLNLATLDISPATITSAEMSYPGATITATTNADGLLTDLHIDLPMSGGGSGKFGVSISLEIEGSSDVTYTFTY